MASHRCWSTSRSIMFPVPYDREFGELCLLLASGSQNGYDFPCWNLNVTMPSYDCKRLYWLMLLAHCKWVEVFKTLRPKDQQRWNSDLIEFFGLAPDMYGTSSQTSHLGNKHIANFIYKNMPVQNDDSTETSNIYPRITGHVK